MPAATTAPVIGWREGPPPVIEWSPALGRPGYGGGFPRRQGGSAAAQHVHRFLVGHRLLVDQLVAGLAREGLEVAQGARVGGHDAQHFAGGHLRQGLLGLQDGQGAVQPAGVEFLVRLHGGSWVGAIMKGRRAQSHWGSLPRPRNHVASAWPVPAGQQRRSSGRSSLCSTSSGDRRTSPAARTWKAMVTWCMRWK